MTHSPTPAELLAIRTGNAALLNSPDSTCDIVSTIVFALGSACLLRSPETADEVKRLRARVAELEAAAGDGSTRTVDEDRIAYELTPEALHASSGAVFETPTAPLVEPNGCALCGIPKPHGIQYGRGGGHTFVRPTDEQVKERMLRRRSVNELRALLARQREGDGYVSPLHRDYRTPHDLPSPEVQS